MWFMPEQMSLKRGHHLDEECKLPIKQHQKLLAGLRPSVGAQIRVHWEKEQGWDK